MGQKQEAAKRRELFKNFQVRLPESDLSLGQRNLSVGVKCSIVMLPAGFEDICKVIFTASLTQSQHEMVLKR